MTISAERALILLPLAAGILLSAGPLRQRVVASPYWVLAIIIAFDVVTLLWSVIPYVPNGYDESQFLMQAHRVRGADLQNCWIRTPLPVLAIAYTPWHVALPGIVAKQIATVCAFHLARMALAPGIALYAALLTSVTSVLLAQTCQVLSEPFGAAALAAFALCAAAGGPWGLFVSATFGFLSRWQLLWLLPIATLLSWRRRGWVAAIVGSTLSAAGIVVTIWWVDVDPVRAFLQEKERLHTVWDRLLYYGLPDVSLGLGPAAMICLVIGVVAHARDRKRDPRIAACTILFAIYFAGVVSMGIITRRFMAPAVPLGCVLVAAGIQRIGQCWPRLRLPLPAGLLLTALAILTALPVPHPRSRDRKLKSPQAEVSADLARLHPLVRGETLYADVDTLMLDAILAQNCIAVGAGHTEPGPKHVLRAQVPPGSMYLTFDAAGREPIWSSARLALVRW